MQKSRVRLVGFYVFMMLLLSVTALRAAPQDPTFVGSWDMTVTGGGQGGAQGGGQDGDQAEGAGKRGGRAGAQSLTITQDGDKFKVSHKTRRGENAYDATVSGNTISWTEERTGREGGTMKVQCKATLDGDTMTGTMASGKFSREFTAKRSAQN